MTVSPTVEELIAASIHEIGGAMPCPYTSEPHGPNASRHMDDARRLLAAAKEHGLVVTASEDGELDVERLRAAIISSSALFHGNPNPDREQTLATIAAKDIAREYERLRR